MRITLDTKEDTFEDIQKVLHILTGILEKKGSTISSAPQNIDTSSMMNMLSETPTTTPPVDKAPDFSSFLNLTKKTEEKGQIEVY